MKLVIETGKEWHSSSSASIQAKFSNTEMRGKYLFEHKSSIQVTKWLRSDRHHTWVLTEYDLPEGVEIEVIAHSWGKLVYHRVWRLDVTAEIQDLTVETRLNDGILKGRLVLVRDLIVDRENRQAKMTGNEGF